MKEPKWSRGNHAVDWPISGVYMTRHAQLRAKGRGIDFEEIREMMKSDVAQSNRTAVIRGPGSNKAITVYQPSKHQHFLSQYCKDCNRNIPLIWWSKHLLWHKKMNTPCKTCGCKRRFCWEQTYNCEKCAKEIPLCDIDKHKKWHDRQTCKK